MSDRFCGLWYDRPASCWVEALPLGNGRLGAMVYGGLQKETVSINEETCWEGAEIDRSNPGALEKLDEIRKAIFEGRYFEAEKIGEEMMGVPPYVDCFQPLCSLDIQFENTGIFRNYRRQLDLENAVHTVQYSIGGDLRFTSNTGLFTRESFVSAADQLFVMRITKPMRKINYIAPPKHTGMSMDISLSRLYPVEKTAQPGRLTLRGQCAPEDRGVRFAAVADVMIEGGSMYCEDNVLKIRQASAIELRLAGATDYAGGDAMEKCLAALENAKNMDFETLKQRHIRDYRALFDRQRFTLHGDLSALPTDALIRSVHAGEDSRALYELWYNYLRYQIICSSRPGCQPSNLQGVWNDNMFAAWNSDYHPNVNMQINNWPTEGYALPECFQPIVDWLEKIAENGRVTAQKHYNARGWVLHHVSDIFHCTAPMDGPWGIWPFGGAWFCRNLYEHYLYTLDRDFLKDRALPLIRGSVEFMLDFLVECPAGIPGEGYLVTCPSHSPENRFVAEDGTVSWLTYGSTMDMQIIRDLFTIYLNTLKILGLSEPLTEDARAARERLVPTRISEKTGCIMEWIDDYQESDPGHRHVSHLYGLYPGNEICELGSEYLDAAEKTLERRLSHNYHAAGWCCGWIASMFARLHRGSRSLDLLNMIVRTLTLPNLMVDAHGNAQVGDAQAVAATVQEMLAQSHQQFIELLPALPAEWKEGEITGLRLRGAHTVDMVWQEGKLVSAHFLAGCDGEVRIRTELKTAVDENGQAAGVWQDGMLRLDARKGVKYCLKA